MEREKEKGGETGSTSGRGSRCRGNSCWEGSDLTGGSHGARLDVRSEGVGVRPKHEGLSKTTLLLRQIRRGGQSFLQQEISTDLESRGLAEHVLSIQGSRGGIPYGWLTVRLTEFVKAGVFYDVTSNVQLLEMENIFRK